MKTAYRLAGPTLAALALHLLYLAIYLRPYGLDPGMFCCPGANRIGHPPYELLTRAAGPSGHDGQFYYALAQAPWQAHGEDIDCPPGRHIRILYPALGWVLSWGGDPGRLLIVLPLINWLAAGGLAAVGGYLALRCERSAWWGFILPLAVNIGLSGIHNFTDALSSLAVVSLLAAWYCRGPGWLLGLLAAAAVLSREQNAAVVALVGLAAIATRRYRDVAWVTAGSALWLGWVGWLWMTYHQMPFMVGDANFTTPLVGLWSRWSHLGDDGLRQSFRKGIFQGAGLAHLCLLIGIGVWLLPKQVGFLARGLMAVGACLALLGGKCIYYDFASYLRVFAVLPIGIWMSGMFTGRLYLLWFLTPGALWSLIGALRYI